MLGIMKYFTYVAPGEAKEYVTLSELELIKTYWPEWHKEKCERYGHRFVESTYNFDDFIQEWVIDNKAIQERNMNDNIGNLVAQADRWCDQNFPGDPFYEVRWEEKFADLIIKDIIRVLENVKPGYEDYRSQIEESMKDYCIHSIINYYGVKND